MAQAGQPAPAAPNYVFYCSPAELAAQQAAGLRNPLPVVGNVPAPWIYKPKSGTDLYGTDRANLLAVVGNTAVLTPAPAFVIAGGYEGVLGALWLTVILPVAGTQIQFSLLKNDGPVLGWAGLTPIGAAGPSVTMPVTGPLQLEENDVLTVRAVNAGGTGPHDVQVDWFGWQYSVGLRRAIYGDAPGV